jgi:hypothetical protein
MYSTSRQAYIDILTELLKEEAPTLYLEDFLYYYNKAISEYMKTRYELFEVTQQLSDDLRSWKKDFNTSGLIVPIDSIYETHEGKKIDLYRHLLGCIISATVIRPISKCDQRAGINKSYKVTRMSSEIKAGILNNVYLEPRFYRPYFEVIGNTIKINIGDKDTKSIEISNIVIEYLCQPAYVDLTEEQVEIDEDTSQVLEFSKDVGEEISKVALKLILERGSSPRTQSHIAVNQAISDVSTGMKGGK